MYSSLAKYEIAIHIIIYIIQAHWKRKKWWWRRTCKNSKQTKIKEESEATVNCIIGFRKHGYLRKIEDKGNKGNYYRFSNRHKSKVPSLNKELAFTKKDIAKPNLRLESFSLK